jgi:hypothetical protein
MRTIDADKLVDMLYDNEFAVLCPLDEVSGVVDACPTVDAMPVVHGRWGHLGGDEWCCSVCGFVITTEGSWDKPAKKYCEDCGAKMDGERKDGGDG